MIPDAIIEFLKTATVGIGGTRDKDLVPHVHRLSGWFVEPDRQTITCLVAEHFIPDLIPSLEDNGHFAVTVCEVPSHETYQFKGDFVSARSYSESDSAAFEQCRSNLVDRGTKLFGFSEDSCRASAAEPSMAVSFKVREIYLQTPGPGAGRRLVPAEE